MVVSADGNVGIGTAVPTAALHVADGRFYSPGSVVQCVTRLYTDRTTYTATNTNAATEITVLNLLITPKRANSKIVLQWMINGEVEENAVFLVYRDSSAIGFNTASGFTAQWSGVTSAPYDANQDSTQGNIVVNWVDLPNTTNTVTYSVRVRSSTTAGTRTFYLGRTISTAGSDNNETTCSTGVAWEICV
jgi:hypothetical protein